MPGEPIIRLSLSRVRIHWIILIAFLLVSVVPIWLYHQRVLQLSEQKLVESERVQQTETTRSLAEEVHLFERTLHQQLTVLRQIFYLTGLTLRVDEPARARQVTTLLENFISTNPDILYISAIGKSARGQRAGSYRAEEDAFITRALQRAFFFASQGLEFSSDPVTHGPENRPAFVVALPLQVGEEFAGMLAAVVSLDRVVNRLVEVSKGGREVYLVTRDGRVVAHPQPRQVIPGADFSHNEIVARMKEIEVRTTETRSFVMEENGRLVDYIGTFSHIADLQWAVVAQRKLDDARTIAGVDDLNLNARIFVLSMVAVALVLGYFFSMGITAPIQGLAEVTRAISRGEFHQRAEVRGAAEVSQLAETFNRMAGDIQEYIERIMQAAEENRELFIGSIRMLAAAIDEKDPYTRGHSGRVAKYSVTIGEQLGMSTEELDRLRISALLHDVGKIGVDDRVLKKPGTLTADEFELMKQHPVKGANIMRPVAQLKEMLPGIELHHEHVDGKGYPYGLRGEEIPLMARIIAVADTLDAMTTNRPYQSAQDLNFAMDKIRKLAGTKFDSRVTQALDVLIADGKLRLSPTLVEV